MYHTPFYTSLKMLQVLLCPALECVFPFHFSFKGKMLAFPIFQRDIHQLAHKLVGNLFWLLFPHQNHLAHLSQLKENWLERHIFYFNFNFLLVYCAKHTKTQCASASKSATCTYVHMFFSAPTHNENLSTRMDFSIWRSDMPRYPSITLDK